MKSEEDDDSLDTFIRQAIGNEPLLPFSRTGDSPVQWIQLLHALDQPDTPGWPLLTPLKVQMQKCVKCFREFCSPVNYRRHSRVHRRSLNADKEWHINRDLLAEFWDKLSLEEAKEVVAFDDVMLKGIPGSSVLRALASSLRKPEVWSLPPVYVKAGATLLDIIQTKPCRLPISSQELFSILDDASEKTFLCAGAADAVKRYVFDGETVNHCLELKNLVASTSFLFEQQLVKAWIAEKDAEALRCQELLVEEEEAAQKRQAALLARKKLRQKEQKVKELSYDYNSNLNVAVDEVERPVSAEEFGSDSNSNSPDTPSNLESVQSQSKVSDENTEPQSVYSTEVQMGPATGHRRFPKPQRGSRYGFHVSQNHQISKSQPVHKFGPSKDRAVMNKKKVWTKKVKINNDGESIKKPQSLQEENNFEVVIGSISVDLKKFLAQQQKSCPNEAQDSTCSTKQAMLEKVHVRTQSNESSFQSESTNNDDRDNLKDTNVLSEEKAQQANLPFSIEAAREFLAQRWKEAIASDHVKLVLSPRPARSDENYSTASDVTNLQERTAVGNPDKQFGRNGHLKFRKKPEKSMKVKYIPKQKAAA